MTPALTPCGFWSRCGRPAGHRGHHGGWRSGVAATAADVTEHDADAEDRLGVELTARQLQVLAEVLVHGTTIAAADCLGISVQTTKNHVTSVIARTGANSARQAAVALGWVHFPAGVAGRHQVAA